MLEVSRAASYARRSSGPRSRAVRDAELTLKIAEVHAGTRGSYGPRASTLRSDRAVGRPAPGRPADAAGRPAESAPQTAPRTTVSDPNAAARLQEHRATSTNDCLKITPMRRHYLHPDRGGLALPGHPGSIDITSHRFVGWAAADHLETELVADALRGACHTRRPEIR